MISVLQHVGFDSAVGQGLAIGGETGTLADVFGDTAVAGRIRGKTGTLNNVPYDQDPPAVKALAGYLPVEGGGAIEYALLLNGGIITDQSEYRPVWTELVNALTSFPAVASPGALGPQ
jgi:D-alanyl-D-alanine carboxypeptidase/D-alanyl-D-alanine-endopeptidase (penicillin-binding protein 4)